MEKVVVVFAILSNDQILASWTHPDQKHRHGLLPKVIKVANTPSLLIRKLQCDDLWVYYFSQDEYRFVLAAAGPERELRMKNYLKVIADLFYQLYDQRKFPTVLNCLMTQINRIEGSEHNQEELQRLTNPNLHSHKLRFTSLLTKQRWTRTYKLAATLIVCILLLTAYYFSRLR